MLVYAASNRVGGSYQPASASRSMRTLVAEQYEDTSIRAHEHLGTLVAEDTSTLGHEDTSSRGH